MSKKHPAFKEILKEPRQNKLFRVTPKNIKKLRKYLNKMSEDGVSYNQSDWINEVIEELD